jgi:hypothetical protein
MTGEPSISVLGSVSFGWLHEQGGFAFDEPFFMDPLVRVEREATIRDFVAGRFPEDPVYAFEAHLVQVEGRRRPVALVGGLQPNLILGAAVGATLRFWPDKDPDITPTPLADLKDVDVLRRTRWANTWPVSLFLDQIGHMREELGDTHAIIPPFFWDTTGRATTHGIVTTAQKLMGERVFLELADDPAFARDFFAWIVDAYTDLIALFADAAGIAVTGLHTGECSGCMISPNQYAGFVVPGINELGRRVGPIRLHSCGPSDHLLDAFGDVELLASLNVGSDTNLARIRERFGPIRVDVAPDLRLLAGGTPAEIDQWVRHTIEENGDGRLEFQYHLDRGLPEANCRQIHRTLGEIGISTPREAVY